MQGNIYREVFPTFLAKKSYDWWITRRRMEIYTKISKRKDLVWSRQKQGKIRTTQGGVRIWKVLCTAKLQDKALCRLNTRLQKEFTRENIKLKISGKSVVRAWRNRGNLAR